MHLKRSTRWHSFHIGALARVACKQDGVALMTHHQPTRRHASRCRFLHRKSNSKINHSASGTSDVERNGNQSPIPTTTAFTSGVPSRDDRADRTRVQRANCAASGYGKNACCWTAFVYTKNGQENLATKTCYQNFNIDQKHSQKTPNTTTAHHNVVTVEKKKLEGGTEGDLL